MRLLRLIDALRHGSGRPRAPAGTPSARAFAAGPKAGGALAFLFSALALLPAAAQNSIPAYAADAVYRTPDGTESTGRVIKSGPDMRLEFTEAGRAVVQIIRRAEGRMYVLDPASRSYFTVQGEPDPQAGAASYEAPCDPNVTTVACRFLGNEVTSGITAEIWEIGQPGDTTQVSRILWDGARHRALRQEYPDGTVMALAFQAMAQIEGRNVEHWSITVTVPGQAPLTGAWFYDPELRVELREELPTGEIRSLRNIAVGAVDPGSFTVPAGWSEMSPPGPPGPGTGSGVPMPPSAN